MAESQIEKPLENEVDLAESTIEFLGSLHPFFSRALIYLLLLFIALTLAWAWYGQVDIVATAPFRLVPLGKVQNIQAPRSGEIQKIAIASGDRIVEEQILFRLHSRETLQEFRELEQAEIAFKQAEFDLQQTLPKKEFWQRRPFRLSSIAFASCKQSCRLTTKHLETMLKRGTQHPIHPISRWKFSSDLPK